MRQVGALAGVRNTVWTQWLGAGQAFAGLSGRITLAGNGPGFSEALVLVGRTDGDARACLARNGTALPGVPAIARFWAGILKSNDEATVTLPVAFRLPVPVPGGAAGTCLTTLVSAGYPFLRRDRPLYTTVTVHFAVATAPPGPPVLAFGIGGEFKLDSARSDLGTYVGLRAERPLDLDGIAAAISAAPVTGAPPQAHWGGPVAGPWQVATRFALVPARLCATAGYKGHSAGPDFSVLREGAPIPVAPPAGSTIVAQMVLTSAGAIAAQSAAFHPPAPGMQTLRLLPGDCLVAMSTADGGSGFLDVENQSTAYLVRATSRVDRRGAD